MPALSTFSKGQLIAHIFRTASAAKPTGLFVALYHADTTEVSGGGYTRVQHGPGDAYWRDQAGGNGATSNIGSIQFPTPTGSWGAAVTHWKILDQLDNVWLEGALASPKNVTLGDPAPLFPDGALAGVIA